MRSIQCSSLLFAAIVLSAADAHAYIDAGTGSLVIQSVLGVILAAMFTLKLYWQKVRSILGLPVNEKQCCNSGSESKKDQSGAEH